jgi:hypothetical protein
MYYMMHTGDDYINMQSGHTLTANAELLHAGHAIIAHAALLHAFKSRCRCIVAMTD